MSGTKVAEKTAQKQESSLLKNFGKVFEIFRVIVNAILSKGGDDSNIMRILKEPDLVDKIADLLCLYLIDCRKACSFQLSFGQPVGIKWNFIPTDHESIDTLIDHRNIHIANISVYRPTRRLRIEDVLNHRFKKDETICGPELFTTYFAGGPIAEFMLKNPELFDDQILKMPTIFYRSTLLFLGTVYMCEHDDCRCVMAIERDASGSLRQVIYRLDKVFDRNMFIVAFKP